MRVLSALVLAAACGGAPPAPPVMPPARVVSLAPSITEIVYALGAADRLVGVCAQCNYPEAAAQLPRVGGYLVPNVEAVVAARPDLVLVVPSPGNRDAVHAVERTGIRVVVVQDRTLEDLWTSMRTVAAALDLAERGEGLVTDVQRRLEAVRGRVAGLGFGDDRGRHAEYGGVGGQRFTLLAVGTDGVIGATSLRWRGLRRR